MLPIAVGCKRSSSKPIPKCAVVEEEDEDGTPLLPRLPDGADPCSIPRVAICFSADGILKATISITYYELVRTNDGELGGTVACVHIHSAPASKSYSPIYRDVLHRIRLPDSEQRRKRRKTDSEPYRLEATATFSTDASRLALLIPYPEGRRSILVIFQMRRQRSDSYSSAPAISSNLPNPDARVAANPHVVGFQNNRDAVFCGATSLCNVSVPNDEMKTSFLLAGCSNGSILIVSYRLDDVVGYAYKAEDGSVESQEISHLQHVTSKRKPEGKLLVVDQSGNARVFHSLFDNMTKTGGLSSVENGREGLFVRRSSSRRIREDEEAIYYVWMTLAFSFQGKFSYGRWINESFLVLLPTPDHSEQALAEVYVCESKSSKLMSRLKLHPQQLGEMSHAHLPIERIQRETTRSFSPCTAMSIDVDSVTEALVVSSFVVCNHMNDSKMIGLQLCCCVWNFWTNSSGLISTAESRIFVDKSNGSLRLPYMLFAHPKFIVDEKSSSNLALHVCQLGEQSLQGRMPRMRQEWYALSTLCPSSSSMGFSPVKGPESNLSLGSRSLLFPVASEPTSRPNKELLWIEAQIPPSYVSSHGRARIAAISEHHDGLVAVAASRGICVLKWDIRKSDRSVRNSSVTDVGGGGDVAKSKSKRWRRFVEMEESSFATVALKWWGSHSEIGIADSFLIAVIEVQGQHYISCFGRKSLAFDDQLIVANERDGDRHGFRLPPTFTPRYVSFAPILAVGKSSAIVLLSDENGYCFLYRLVMMAQNNTTGQQKIQVEATLLHGFSLGPERVRPFIAGAGVGGESETLMTTVGLVSSETGKLRAFTVSENKQVSVQYVIVDDAVSSCWLTDMRILASLKEHVAFGWTVQLLTGKTLVWSLPNQPEGKHHVSPTGSAKFGASWPIDERLPWLGSVCYLGDSTLWMQRSTNTSQDLLLGPETSSEFGCLIRSGQGHRKIKQDSSVEKLLRRDTTSILTMNEAQITIPSHTMILTGSLIEERDLIDGDFCLLDSLRARRFEAAVHTVGKLLLMRFVERVASAQKKGRDENRSARMLGRTIQALERNMKAHTISSLFLQLGRQLEPSCVQFLLLPPMSSSNGENQRTADALVNCCMTAGSLSTPSSSMQLLRSKEDSLSLCQDLVHEALVSIQELLSAEDLVTFDDCLLERQLLPSLVRYGFQLEDLEDNESWDKVQPSKEDISPSRVEVPELDIAPPSSVIALQKRSSKTSYFPLLFCRSRRKRSGVDSAVNEAASVFIMSGFEDSDYEFIVQETLVAPGGVSFYAEEPVSVTELILNFLMTIGFLSSSRWNRLGVFGTIMAGSSNSQGLLMYSLNTFESLSAIALRCTLRDLVDGIELLEEKNGELSNTDDDLEDVVVDFLLSNMMKAHHELAEQSARHLLDLCAILAARVFQTNQKNYSSAELSILLLLSVVVGQRIGKNLFAGHKGNEGDYPIEMCYLLAVNEMVDSV